MRKLLQRSSIRLPYLDYVYCCRCCPPTISCFCLRPLFSFSSAGCVSCCCCYRWFRTFLLNRVFVSWSTWHIDHRNTSKIQPNFLYSFLGFVYTWIYQPHARFANEFGDIVLSYRIWYTKPIKLCRIQHVHTHTHNARCVYIQMRHICRGGESTSSYELYALCLRFAIHFCAEPLNCQLVFTHYRREIPKYSAQWVRSHLWRYFVSNVRIFKCWMLTPSMECLIFYHHRKLTFHFKSMESNGILFNVFSSKVHGTWTFGYCAK